jgi:hypothetical protein
MAENPADLQMLADVLGRTVHACKLDSASAIGAALLTGFVDEDAYFSEIRKSVFSPTNNTRRYDQVYARYIAQFPAATWGRHLRGCDPYYSEGISDRELRGSRITGKPAAVLHHRQRIDNSEVTVRVTIAPGFVVVHRVQRIVHFES